MPLDQFISETMTALAGDEEEIALGNAASLRGASASIQSAFPRMNP